MNIVLILGLVFLLGGIVLLIIGGLSVSSKYSDSTMGIVKSVTKNTDGTYTVVVTYTLYSSGTQATFKSTLPHSVGDAVTIYYKSDVSSGTIDPDAGTNKLLGKHNGKFAIGAGAILTLVGIILLIVYSVKQSSSPVRPRMSPKVF